MKRHDLYIRILTSDESTLVPETILDLLDAAFHGPGIRVASLQVTEVCAQVELKRTVRVPKAPKTRTSKLNIRIS